jgi:hypothetical protein
MAPNPFCCGCGIQIMRIHTGLFVTFLFFLASNTALAQKSGDSSNNQILALEHFIGLSLDSTKKLLSKGKLSEEKQGNETVLVAKFEGDSTRGGNMSVEAIVAAKGVRKITFNAHFFTDESYTKSLGDIDDIDIFPGGRMTAMTADGEYTDMLVHFEMSPKTRDIQYVITAK